MDAAKHTSFEFGNKHKCIELEQKVLSKQTQCYNLTSPKLNRAICGMKEISTGCYVKVKPDLSPGKCSFSGSGFMINTDGDGPARFFLVRYGLDGAIKNDIPYLRVTETWCPFGKAKPVCDKRAPETFDNNNKENVALTRAALPPNPTEQSSHWDTQVEEREGGEQTSVQGPRTTECFQKLIAQDARELKGYLSGCGSKNMHTDRNKGGTFKKQAQQYNQC